jgi:hypothetical protein
VQAVTLIASDRIVYFRRSLFHPSHLYSSQPSARSVGRRRNGTSCASSKAPSGAIQNPIIGKKPKTPPMINSTPAGMRTQRDVGALSHKKGPPIPLGSLLESLSSWRSSRSLSRSTTTLFFGPIMHRLQSSRSPSRFHYSAGHQYRGQADWPDERSAER